MSKERRSDQARLLKETRTRLRTRRKPGMSARQPATLAEHQFCSHIESQLGIPQIPWAHCDIVHISTSININKSSFSRPSTPSSPDALSSPRTPITKPRSSCPHFCSPSPANENLPSEDHLLLPRRQCHNCNPHRQCRPPPTMYSRVNFSHPHDMRAPACASFSLSARSLPQRGIGLCYVFDLCANPFICGSTWRTPHDDQDSGIRHRDIFSPTVGDTVYSQHFRITPCPRVSY